MAEKKIDPLAIQKEQIARLLRSADEFTRDNRFDDAILELERVLRIDAKHSYARSFLERVRYMQKKADQSWRQQTEEAEQSLDQRMTVISRHLASAEAYMAVRNFKQALAVIAEIYRIDPTNYYARAFSERIEAAMQQEQGAARAAQAEQAQKPLPRGNLMMYRELLKEVWFDGKVTPEEAEELARVREAYAITREEHEQLERDVRVDAYYEALCIAWRDNVLTDVERSALQTMREKYGISQEELAAAEAKFDASKRALKTKGTVLIVDGDQNALVFLSKRLKSRGYDSVLASSPENALQLLAGQTPDLILTDVAFPGQQIDGFEFLERVRQQPALKRVPFFCMTTSRDPKVIRAGLRLGIDFLLAKPVDIETFIAALEGRLRRVP